MSQIENYGEEKHRAGQRILAPEMEIMRETSSSRIKGQNNVHQEFLQIVDNGSRTDSVLEETIEVFVTILISLEKYTVESFSEFYNCSKMKEKRREPEGKRESPSGGMFR